MTALEPADARTRRAGRPASPGGDVEAAAAAGADTRAHSGSPRRYRTIVVDPPWPLRWDMGTVRKDGRGVERRPFKRQLGYPTLTIDAISQLPVADRAASDAALFLWIPDQFLIEGAGALVARAWGFEPGRVILWWAKRGYGLGTFPRPQHEALLVCTRGSPAFAVRDVGSVQEWKQPYENGVRKHSAKPDGAYDLIERASAGPYLELFARRARFGWDYWGAESLGTADLPDQLELEGSA